MPLATVQTYLKGQLDGLNLPLGMGNLTAVIQPPADGENLTGDGSSAVAYIWSSAGDESRRNAGTVPRAQHGNLASGGNKTLEHRCNIWLVWFGDQEASNVDVAFPGIIDFVMGVLRNVEMLDVTQHAHDPINGQLSNLLNVGENMSWEYGPVRATTQQRYLRYDALINVEVIEIIQA